MAERRAPATATDAEMAVFRRDLAELLAIAAERRAKMTATDRPKRGGVAA